VVTINGGAIRKVVVACDAGMGSSVMLAAQLRRQLAKRKVLVEHTAINSIPADADVVICHAGLADRVRMSVPGKVIVPIQVFIGDPAIAKVVTAVETAGYLSG
jgi:mannitol-specific phosphotransferase system IIBC component